MATISIPGRPDYLYKFRIIPQGDVKGIEVATDDQQVSDWFKIEMKSDHKRHLRISCYRGLFYSLMIMLVQ